VEQLQILFPGAHVSWHMWAAVFGLASYPFCLLKTLGHVGAIALLGAATSAIIMLVCTALPACQAICNVCGDR
jgi:hypothetical protein